jgi:hypothetical protein
MRAVGVGAAVAVGVTVLGLPLGLVWSWLAPDVPLVKTADGARLTEPQPEQFVAADGWFSLLGLGFGVLVSILVWIFLRRYRGPVGLVGVAIGTVGAALVAWWLGSRLGLAEFDRLAESAPVGATLNQPPELRAGEFEWLYGFIPTLRGDVLLSAFGAVVVYTLLAGWSRHPGLVPEPEPATALPWPEPGADGPRPGPAAEGPERDPEEDENRADGERLSWRSPEPPAPTAAPAPPVPGPAAPPPD